jgi:peptide-methionine (R)-S-oxide reductase
MAKLGKTFPFLLIIILSANTSCAQSNSNTKQEHHAQTVERKVKLTDEEWKQTLTPAQYYILREKGTERPFSNKYNSNKQKGKYRCAGCKEVLFSSDTKYESGCGWPSFYAPLLEGNIEYATDKSHGMIRTEVLCKSCGGHLGHVFDDGPPPTGLRYCINSESMIFKKD